MNIGAATCTAILSLCVGALSLADGGARLFVRVRPVP